MKCCYIAIKRLLQWQRYYITTTRDATKLLLMRLGLTPLEAENQSADDQTNNFMDRNRFNPWRDTVPLVADLRR